MENAIARTELWSRWAGTIWPKVYIYYHCGDHLTTAPAPPPISIPLLWCRVIFRVTSYTVFVRRSLRQREEEGAGEERQQKQPQGEFFLHLLPSPFPPPRPLPSLPPPPNHPHPSTTACNGPFTKTSHQRDAALIMHIKSFERCTGAWDAVDSNLTITGTYWEHNC